MKRRLCNAFEVVEITVQCLLHKFLFKLFTKSLCFVSLENLKTCLNKRRPCKVVEVSVKVAMQYLLVSLFCFFRRKNKRKKSKIEMKPKFQLRLQKLHAVRSKS